MKEIEPKNELLKSSISKTRVTDSRPRLLFGRTITYGCSGKDVQLLHELLNKDDQTHIDPQRKRPSDHLPNFFGSNTERAVKRFQKKYGIVDNNDPEWGMVGEQTIKKLRSLFGNGSFYLQERRRLNLNPVYEEKDVSLENVSLDKGEFIDRVTRTFLAIFRYWYKGKPIFSVREHAFGSFFSLSFPRAKNSPLLKLFKEANVASYKRVEILVKEGSDQKINDTDIESIIMGTKNDSDTVFIIITSAHVLDEQTERFFRAFAYNGLLLLSVGEQELQKFEGWVKRKNINACLMKLLAIEEELLMLGEPDHWKNDVWRKEQVNFIEKRLDLMGDALDGRLRTIIKKLTFLSNYITARAEIRDACEYTKIGCRTYYYWCKKDPAFRNLLK